MARRSRFRRPPREARWSRNEDWGFPVYVPAAERKAKAARMLREMKKSGRDVAPVEVDGRRIAATFWGCAWCENLERYSDFANRLPRGRTYVRNGSVIDLQIGAGRVDALVSGTDVYEVAVEVAPVARRKWREICDRCAGGIDSVVELLQGRLSKGVMAQLCAEGTGLFPTPREIRFECSCPDSAVMCKHVAAVLYGVGARLDRRPDLLFRLRQVKEEELIASAGTGEGFSAKPPAPGRLLEDPDLAGLFGVEFAAEADTQASATRPRKRAAALRARKRTRIAPRKKR